MDITNVIDAIPKPKPAKIDYIGADGLLYCGKCHKPKQACIDGLEDKTPLPIACDCIKAEEAAETERAQREKIEKLRAQCLPILAMRKRTFDIAGDEKHIKLAKSYVNNWETCRVKNIGLMFYGNTGTGKTFAAQCIANALIDKGIKVTYITAADLVAKFTDRDTPKEEFLNEISKTPLLIIDDIGAERDTGFSREQLNKAIDRRSDAEKPLIVTTNYSLQDLDASTDEAQKRTFDRLRANCVPVAVVGASKRRDVASEKLKLAREILKV